MAIKIVLLILLAEAWTAVGQILFKKAANAVESRSLRGVGTHIRFIRDILMKPLIWFGLASMAAGLVFWLMALSRGDLSFVFPIGSIQYVMILFSAHIFLGEKIDRMKFLGTFLVVFGIILTAMS